MTDRERNQRRTPRRPAADNDSRDINDAGSYYRDREEYFRERDRYYAERDRYYRDRDRFYEEMDGYSRTAQSAAEDVIDNGYYDEPHDEAHYGEVPERKARPVRGNTPGTEKHERHERPSGQQLKGKHKTSVSGQVERKKGIKPAKTAAGPAEPKAVKKKKHPILMAVLAVFIFLIGFVVFKMFTGQSGYYTVAVFGVDSRDGNVGKGALSDVNIIARVDRASGEIKLVSIYRDTYAMISEDGDYHKFNEAYFRGGPEQAVWALEHNTDVKVDDYATFNWKAIVDAINILGGIDLEISDAEFKYINAYITETVNSTGVGSVQLEHAGMNHLDGVQAVAYARLRYMDNDYVRTERQRKVVSLALEKAKQADFATLNNILVTVLPQISTSIGIDDLLPFARNIDKYYLGDTAGFPFDKQAADIGKLDCVVPVTWESNDTALHEFLYPGTPYTPSALVHEISEHVISKSGLGGNGETTITVDDLNAVTGGQAAEETEAVTEPETETTADETETIEEIVDPEAGNGPSDAEDNDSTDPEDMVPEGSNSNVGAGTDQSGSAGSGTLPSGGSGSASGASRPGTSGSGSDSGGHGSGTAGSEAGTSGGSHGSGSNHDTVTGSGDSSGGGHPGSTGSGTTPSGGSGSGSSGPGTSGSGSDSGGHGPGTSGSGSGASGGSQSSGNSHDTVTGAGPSSNGPETGPETGTNSGENFISEEGPGSNIIN